MLRTESIHGKKVYHEIGYHNELTFRTATFISWERSPRLDAARPSDTPIERSITSPR